MSTGSVGGLLRRHGADLVVLPLLVLLALVPLGPAFGTGHLVAATVGGALLGAGVAVAGAVLRWGASTVLAAAVVVLTLCSALAAPTTAVGGVVPTLATVGAVGRGVVTSWKEIVTVLPPLGAGGAVLTAPYLLAFTGTLVALTVALRTARPAWAVLAPGLVLPVAILLGTAEASGAAVVGTGGALIGLVWARWRAGRVHAGRLRAAAVLVLVGAVAGGGVAAVAPPSGPRVVLRDVLEPPPDPRDYPSPLAGFRSYVKDHRDEAVLTVAGLPADTRVRLAVLDAYDGTAWAVSGEAASGTFRRVGERIEPDLPGGLDRLHVTVGEYAGVWVPMVGRPYDVDFAAPRLGASFYVNRGTGTGLTTVGLRPGDTYELLAAPVREPTDSELEGAPLAVVPLPAARYPEVAGTAAARMVADARTPLAQIRAIESGLQQGYYSHGLEGDTPSLPGHGAARIDALLGGEAMVGDEEQYAAAMALMLRAIGIPSRVVMGFAAPAGATGAQAPGDPAGAQAPGDAAGSVALTGDDVTAWVEVPFEGHGWVPFFPTPDEDRIWQQESPTPQNRPQPQVLQPPPPAPEPPDAPPSDRREVDTDDEPEDDAGWPQALLVAAGVVGGLLVLVSPLLLVLALKARRRARRRSSGTPSQRVAGGWAELVDAAADLGVPVRRGATRLEAAREVAGALAVPPGLAAGTAELAERADAGTFAAGEPDDGAVEGYWRDVAAALAGLGRAVGRRRWWRARVSPRSLRRPRQSRTGPSVPDRRPRAQAPRRERLRRSER
ncbi:transglutaminaseTgpA domain-containing protein [Georgenia thermotolerans]|uniref:Transglutaminase domain-containing protein n=1 Tax=Georgenia thermotolerans TaxID=527326 RepID=A0A7J5ULE9_9MICO|nr:transglutaminaseTgpA domain-containing protein [Georgenia thermotolerans]KAE8763110.1 transglutaminase domain-containing protein [Georgenia thermotolerans]